MAKYLQRSYHRMIISLHTRTNIKFQDRSRIGKTGFHVMGSAWSNSGAMRLHVTGYDIKFRWESLNDID